MFVNNVRTSIGFIFFVLLVIVVNSKFECGVVSIDACKSLS